MPRHVALAVVACLLAGPVAAAATLEDRVYAVARELMCPTCVGQTVAESASPLAVQMRAVIRERLARGETPEQIKAYFVSQFGESVLAVPPRRGLGLVVWAAPAVALLGALTVLAVFLRKAVR